MILEGKLQWPLHFFQSCIRWPCVIASTASALSWLRGHRVVTSARRTEMDWTIVKRFGQKSRTTRDDEHTDVRHWGIHLGVRDVCVCVQCVLLVNKIQTDSYLCSALHGRAKAWHRSPPWDISPVLNLETEWTLLRSSCCFLRSSLSFLLSDPSPSSLLSPLLSSSTCNLC